MALQTILRTGYQARQKGAVSTISSILNQQQTTHPKLSPPYHQQNMFGLYWISYPKATPDVLSLSYQVYVGTCMSNSKMTAEILLKLWKSNMILRWLRWGKRIIKKTPNGSDSLCFFPTLSLSTLNEQAWEQLSWERCISIFHPHLLYPGKNASRPAPAVHPPQCS